MSCIWGIATSKSLASLEGAELKQMAGLGINFDFVVPVDGIDLTVSFCAHSQCQRDLYRCHCVVESPHLIDSGDIAPKCDCFLARGNLHHHLLAFEHGRLDFLVVFDGICLTSYCAGFLYLDQIIVILCQSFHLFYFTCCSSSIYIYLFVALYASFRI